MVEKVLGNLPTGLVFVVSAPAGTGKTTLVGMLTEEFDEVVESISCTTRAPRPSEKNGVDYHFLSKSEFETKIRDNEFLEYAEVFGNYYGTSRKYVLDQQKKGKHVVLVIDTQGAIKLKNERFPATFIFLSPPSLEELKERLVKRKTEDEETLRQRLSWATQEMQIGARYDYMIVNKDLHVAYDILRSIIIAEEHRLRPKS